MDPVFDGIGFCLDPYALVYHRLLFQGAKVEL